MEKHHQYTKGNNYNSDSDALNCEWRQRAEIIGHAILHVFPITLIDQKLLKQIIKNLASQKSFFSRLFSCCGEWYDDELLDFVELLKEYDWSQINWNENRQVIPLFTEPILAYCFPGILMEIVTESFDDIDITAETLISSFLFPAIVQSDKSKLDMTRFTAEQKQVIVEFLLLLRDLLFVDDLKIQSMINDILLRLSERFEMA
ncbi:MAG: hypothetical protein LBE12_06945 [Planctomycetaceae bacterium]|jgi:hypothetical protein|nr:hypothetical protein [Planctomycetaceae bacterium]